MFKYAKFGTAWDVLQYTASGESDDWFYDQGIISMSPEVGHEEDGFWPPQGAILGIAQRNFARVRLFFFEAPCSFFLRTSFRMYHAELHLKGAGGFEQSGPDVDVQQDIVVILDNRFGCTSTSGPDTSDADATTLPRPLHR